MSSPLLEGGAYATKRTYAWNAEALDLFSPVVEEVVDTSEQLPILSQIIGSEEVHGRVARQRREVAHIVKALALIGEACAKCCSRQRQPGDDGTRQIVRSTRQLP